MLIFVLLALCVFVEAAPVHEGMSRQEVETALGKPVAVMQHGNRLVLTYSKGGRVELVEGRVVEMVSVPVSTESVPALVSPPKVEPGTESADPAESVVETTNQKGKSPEASKQIERTVVDKTSEEKEIPRGDSRGRVALMFLLGAVVRIVIVMVVLKLAFKWADVHADWGQMFFPALADTLVRSGFGFLGSKVLHVTSWFYLDEAAAYFALLFVLMKTTHACTLARAVAVGAAAKLMSIVVGSVLVVFLLRLMA